ncbi:hypothetical protein [Embleya sp. NPDC005971]|uniref:hypothetical protein n=1 Tax=Embleya sp. NPDC005971 TaxID=3156724 RepID=UPI0033E5EC22
MDRTNLTRPGGDWDALRLDVPESARPSLRLLAAHNRRFVLIDTSAESGPEAYAPSPLPTPAPLLLAEVDPEWYGVDYRCPTPYRSPLAPLRAAEARAVGTVNDPAWYPRWAHRMADELSRNGPLYGGTWVLSRDIDRTRLRFPEFAAPTLPSWPEGHIDFNAHTYHYWEILPLHPLASAEDGRVKAYRKQVRDGSLPPVLVWWVSMLQTHLVLDGHDRLAASLAEGRVPPLLVLSRPTEHDVYVAGPVDGYERRMAAIADVPEVSASNAVRDAGRQLARDLFRLRAGYGLTRAWPLKGGVPAWQHLVARHAPDWTL